MFQITPVLTEDDYDIHAMYITGFMSFIAYLWSTNNNEPVDPGSTMWQGQHIETWTKWKRLHADFNSFAVFFFEIVVLAIVHYYFKTR